MKNILLLTMTVSPYRGSEFAVGWNYIKHMGTRNNLFVVYADYIPESGMENAVEKFSLKNTKLFLCGSRDYSLKHRNILEYHYNNQKDNKRLHLLAFEKAKEITNLLYLIGNKNDLYEYFQIDENDIINYAMSNNLRYFSTSCITGYGISEFIYSLANELYRRA